MNNQVSHEEIEGIFEDYTGPSLGETPEQYAAWKEEERKRLDEGTFESDPFKTLAPEIEDDDPTLIMPALELAELRRVATPAVYHRPPTPPKPFLTVRDCPAAKAKVGLALDSEGI